MPKKLAAFCLSLLAVLLFSAPALADTGPKPSVVLDFIGLEGQRCYVTLLSQTASTGPHSAKESQHYAPLYSPEDESYDVEGYDIWQKFTAYEDADGYYFLQFFGECSDNERFVWGYYPPQNFKILLYFPEQGSFMASGPVYSAYAFDSYFTVHVGEAAIGVEQTYATALVVEKTYNYMREISSMLARLLITLALEIALALVFGFGAKKQLLVILYANIATQTVLNIVLNLVNYSYGWMMFLLAYVLLEVAVIIIEASIYGVYLNRYSQRGNTRKWLPALYALAANTASFCTGLFIAVIMPGIF